MGALVVPVPGLVLLIGPAGSGKSTFAARQFDAAEVLSSDAFRERIAGDAADQRATRPAFAALGRALAGRLARGRLTVVDATSLTRAARLQVLRAANAARVPSVAIVFDLPAEVVRSRNETRERVVRPEVVTDHLDRVRALVDDGRLAVEGFETVYVLRIPRQVDEVRIVRRRARPRSAMVTRPSPR
jgi:protein phosphatase